MRANKANRKFRKLQIFVASPGDVSTERTVLAKTIQSLNRSLADHFEIVLELKEWCQVIPGMGRTQGVILSQIPADSWDVFTGILWLRFGTPSGKGDPTTGRSYESGTEEEFHVAYQNWKKTGRPRIMVYRCTRPPEDIRQLDREQYARVSRFFEQFDNSNSEHAGLYFCYKDPEEFRQYVEEHLAGLLIELHKQMELPNLRSTRGLARSPTRSAKPNPFVVGKPITTPQAFFGRAREVRFSIARLTTLQSVSITGPRRIGKTSMLHFLLHEVSNQTGGSLEPVFIDLLSPNVRTLVGLLAEVQQQLGLTDPATSLPGFVQRLALLYRSGRRPLIALDELEIFVKLPTEFSQDFCEALRAEACAGHIVLLTASRSSLREMHNKGALVSPLYNIMGQMKLGPFSQTEAREFITSARHGVKFTKAQQAQILKRGQGHPLRLQSFCWHAAEAISANRRDWRNVWREAEDELAQFRLDNSLPEPA